MSMDGFDPTVTYQDTGGSYSPPSYDSSIYTGAQPSTTTNAVPLGDSLTPNTTPTTYYDAAGNARSGYMNPDGSITNSDTGQVVIDSNGNAVGANTYPSVPGGSSVPSLSGINTAASGASGIGSALGTAASKLGSNLTNMMSSPAGLLQLLGLAYGLAGGAKPGAGPGANMTIPKYTYNRGVASIPTSTPNTNPSTYGAPMMGHNYFPDNQGYVPAAEGGLMPGRYLAGPTDGMSDDIHTSIDGTEPARLSHGEFIVPADVVSHLGNGNSDAGADVLHKMMDRVREARTGTEKQGKEINPEKFVPGIKGLATGGRVKKFAAGDQALASGYPTPTAASVASTGTPISQTSNVSPWAGDYISQMLGQAQALGNQPMPIYTGQLTAGTSPVQQQTYDKVTGLQTPDQMNQAGQAYQGALTGLQGLNYSPQAVQAPAASAGAANYNPNLQTYQMGPAQQLSTQSVLNNNNVQRYMDPYIQNALNVQENEAARQSAIQDQTMHAQLAQAGAYGGSRQAIADSESNRNLALQQQNIEATGMNTAYQNALTQFNTEQQQALQAQAANQQAGLTVGEQNLGAQLGVQQLGTQTALQQAISNAQLGTQASIANAGYGVQTAGQNIQNRQFGANLGLQGLQSQLQGAQGLGALGYQTGLLGLQGANLGLQAGAQQQATQQAGLTAAQNQFNQQMMWPYQQLQFQQSMLNGLPIASNTTATNPSGLQSLSQLFGSTGVSSLFGGTGNSNPFALPTSGTGTTPTAATGP